MDGVQTKRLDLSQLAREFGSSKGAAGYSVVYDSLFAYLRDRDINILEIGLAEGGPEVDGDKDRATTHVPSVEMWRRYFHEPNVVGFDISDFAQFQDARFTFVRGDSGDPADLRKVKDLGIDFDIVIDDASHASYHQQVAFGALFDVVKPGGFYIIEDLNWNPTQYEKTLPAVPKTREWLTDFLVTGQLAPTAGISAETAADVAARVQSLQLYDEHMLNALRVNYNLLNDIPSGCGFDISRPWRGKSTLGKITDPYFLLYNLRRLKATFRGDECVTRENVMLAIVQKRF